MARTRAQSVRPSASAARMGTRHNPVVLEETPEPEDDHVAPAASPRKSKRPPVSRIKAAAIVKPKAPPKVLPKTTPKKRGPAEKRDCAICAATKSIPNSFRLDTVPSVCKHFRDICGACVQNMLKAKISDRKLADGDLGCPFPKCDNVLDQALLKKALTSKSFFEDYSKALLKHHLSSSPNFIACLSSECGKYFSIEGCQGKTRRATKSSAGHKIACPYCDYALCLSCNRPWHTGGCDKAKKDEDAKSLAEIKKIGAKPCPKCGVNIDKDGGCDHMTCHTCRHNFCWQCLVPYDGSVQHLEGCIHGRVNVAIDPGNWIQDNMTEAQLNNLIERAHGPQIHAAPVGHRPPPVLNPSVGAGPWFGFGVPVVRRDEQGPPTRPQFGGGFGFGAGLFNGFLGGGIGGANGGH